MAAQPVLTVVTRLFVALLLATIGLEAVPSGKFAVDRDHGSAFSASSVETAVARQPERLKASVLPLPALPPSDASAALQRVAEAPGGDDRPGLASTGPPPLAITALPYPPRAPPIA